MMNNLLYAMKISEVSHDEFIVEYPFDGLSILGSEETFQDAVELAKSLLQFSLFDMLEANEPLPVVNKNLFTDLEKSKHANEFVIYVSTSKKEIYQRFGEKAVKKTISIPEYMETILNRNSISLSQYVQSKIAQDFLT